MKLQPFAALAAVLFFAISPAQAASDVWTAAMQEDEGGEVMTAWVDGVATEGAEFPPSLRMICFDQVNLRYDMGDLPDDQYPVPGDEHDFTLRSGQTEVTLHMLYEDMDGAFAAYFGKTDPALDLLRAGDNVEITAAADKYPPLSFTLNGAAVAIDALLAACP
ncbi:MAG: hypothetical protein ABIN41_00040 [Devosia sp.]